MLLKPNRKYYQGKSKVFYDFHVHDYLDKLLALSMLKDEDYDDLVIPEGQYQAVLSERLNPDQSRSASPPASRAFNNGGMISTGRLEDEI